jgi:succinate dehydrogenase/fumarate reductase flavoprotein subunit
VPYLQEYEKSQNIQEGVSVRKLKKQLGEILNADAGIYKTQSGLKRAKTMIKDLQTQVAHVKTSGGKGYTQLLELQNAITTAQLVVEASLNRTQSLGAHAIGADDE